MDRNYHQIFSWSGELIAVSRTLKGVKKAAAHCDWQWMGYGELGQKNLQVVEDGTPDEDYCDDLSHLSEPEERHVRDAIELLGRMAYPLYIHSSKTGNCVYSSKEIANVLTKEIKRSVEDAADDLEDEGKSIEAEKLLSDYNKASQSIKAFTEFQKKWSNLIDRKARWTQIDSPHMLEDFCYQHGEPEWDAPYIW